MVLIVKNEYGYNDIYYNRIMFPLWDLNGVLLVIAAVFMKMKIVLSILILEKRNI